MIEKKTEDLYDTIDELVSDNKQLTYQNQELIIQIRELELEKDLKINEQTKMLLQKTKRELNELQNKTYGGTWIFNCLNRKQYWSEEIFHLWGFDPNKATPDYNSVISLIHSNDIKLFKSAFKEARTDGVPFDIEFRICVPNTDQKVIRFICKTVLGANGKVIGLKGTNEDITMSVNYRNELELEVNQRTLKLSEALEQQNQFNSRFVSTTSHELRNPLSAINFVAGSIKKYWEKMDAIMIEKKMHKIENQVAQMTVLLEDVSMDGQTKVVEMQTTNLT
jgi:hypothetical protein